MDLNLRRIDGRQDRPSLQATLLLYSQSQFRIHPYARISTYFGKPKLFPSWHISIYRNMAYKSFIFSVVSFVRSESIPCSCLSCLRSSMILTPNFQKKLIYECCTVQSHHQILSSSFLFNLGSFMELILILQKTQLKK